MSIFDDIQMAIHVYFGTALRYSQMVGRAASTTGTVHADMTLTESKVKVKVKVTGVFKFRKLAKSCMHAGGDDRQPPSGAFWFKNVRKSWKIDCTNIIHSWLMCQVRK